MRSTVYRQLGSVRRCPRPRRTPRTTGLAVALGQMLLKLNFAADKLERARPRRRQA